MIVTTEEFRKAVQTVMQYEEQLKRIDNVIPIESVGLSKRAINGLSKCNVRTTKDLILMDHIEPLKVRRIGKKTYEEIIALQEKLRSEGQMKYFNERR